MALFFNLVLLSRVIFVLFFLLFFLEIVLFFLLFFSEKLYGSFCSFS